MDYTKDIQLALLYIENNLTGDLSSKEIAKKAGMSEFHFQRVFKKQLGMGVYKYLQKRRMAHASLLLLKSELKIIEIALISGFSSQEAFSRVFKSYYQLPPRQYRNQFKNFFRGNQKMCETKINGWLLSGNNFDKYEVTIDQMNFHSGNQSVKMSQTESLYTENFATVMQQVSAKNYINQRVRLSAYLKSESIEGWGGIWLRIDGKNFEQLAFDNMQNRPVTGTNDWNYYSSVLDVSQEAEVLNFGFLLQGKGTLWADDFCLEIVPNDIQTTEFNSEQYYPTEPQNLSFSE